MIRRSYTDTECVSSYTANALNQYEGRTVPGYAGVRGSATNTATVTVNSNPTWRIDDYFYSGDAADNSNSAVMKELEIIAAYSNLYSAATGSVFVAQTPEEFTYDDDGNLLTDGRFTYTWNGENRLIKAETRNDLPLTVPRITVEYAYDHQGRMVWKEITAPDSSSKTITYLWNDYNIISETIQNQQSTITNHYVWGLDLSGSLQGAGGVGGLLAVVNDSELFTTAYDANGNVTEYISDSGTTVAHYEYSPFGEIVVQSGDLADSFTHRFSTKPWCAVTSLSEYELRKYRPNIGRWMSRDPIGEEGGENLYEFTGNNTHNLFDSMGFSTYIRTDTRVIKIKKTWLTCVCQYDICNKCIESCSWQPIGNEYSEKVDQTTNWIKKKVYESKSLTHFLGQLIETLSVIYNTTYVNILGPPSGSYEWPIGSGQYWSFSYKVRSIATNLKVELTSCSCQNEGDVDYTEEETGEYRLKQGVWLEQNN